MRARADEGIEKEITGTKLGVIQSLPSEKNVIVIPITGAAKFGHQKAIRTESS
jgi:hypothetical protein